MERNKSTEQLKEDGVYYNLNEDDLTVPIKEQRPEGDRLHFKRRNIVNPKTGEKIQDLQLGKKFKQETYFKVINNGTVLAYLGVQGFTLLQISLKKDENDEIGGVPFYEFKVDED